MFKADTCIFNIRRRSYGLLIGRMPSAATVVSTLCKVTLVRRTDMAAVQSSYEPNMVKVAIHYWGGFVDISPVRRAVGYMYMAILILISISILTLMLMMMMNMNMKMMIGDRRISRLKVPVLLRESIQALVGALGRKANIGYLR